MNWKSCIAVVVLLCVSHPLPAQERGHLLVFSPAGIIQAYGLLEAVQPYYKGEINVMSDLPLLLDYDAILVTRPGFASADGLIDEGDQLRLIDYIKKGGRFYAQSHNFRSLATNDVDTLWTFIGETQETISSAGIWFDSIIGVADEFTDGLAFSHPFNLDPDLPYGLSIGGMTPVLKGSHELAWRSSNANIKAVLHWPAVNDHYTAFIERLLCNYFQLCALDVVDKENEILKICMDPLTSILHLPRAGTIVITDILGRTAFEGVSSTERLALPPLPHGSYVVTWSDQRERANMSIVVN